MEFGRLCCVRGLLVLAVFFYGLEAVSRAQQPAASPAQTVLPALPEPQPLSQAAAGATPGAPDAAKAAPADSASAPNGVKEDFSQLRLGTGDLVEVSVYNVPELSTKARIGNSGDVYLPLIDYVHLADLSIEEAQVVIQKRLEDGGFVRSPHVTIFVDESTSQGVTILGEVARPGIYPALGDRKLYDLISSAGGFSASAGRKVSIIHAHSQSPPVTVNLPRNLADDLQDNVQIQPGDTITVPRAPVIYVVGDVGHPTGLLVDNGSLTVLQAIALAGGTNHTAKMSATRIIRKTSTGMTETVVPLKKMLEAKVPDVTLQGDDILFVPVSGAKVAATRGAEAIVTAATALTIVAVHP